MTKKEKKKTKKQLINDYDTLSDEYGYIEGEMDSIATELMERFNYDVNEF